MNVWMSETKNWWTNCMWYDLLSPFLFTCALGTAIIHFTWTWNSGPIWFQFCYHCTVRCRFTSIDEMGWCNWYSASLFKTLIAMVEFLNPKFMCWWVCRPWCGLIWCTESHGSLWQFDCKTQSSIWDTALPSAHCFVLGISALWYMPQPRGSPGSGWRIWCAKWRPKISSGSHEQRKTGKRPWWSNESTRGENHLCITPALISYNSTIDIFMTLDCHTAGFMVPST